MKKYDWKCVSEHSQKEMIYAVGRRLKNHWSSKKVEQINISYLKSKDLMSLLN